MHRPTLTITDIWEAALVVLVVGAGAFLLSGLSSARVEPMRERAPQQACLALASPDPACAPLAEPPALQEGRAAGRGAIDLLETKPPRR